MLPRGLLLSCFFLVSFIGQFLSLHFTSLHFRHFADMLILSVSKWINMEDFCVLLWDILTGLSAVSRILQDISLHTNSIPRPILTVIRRSIITAGLSNSLYSHTFTNDLFDKCHKELRCFKPLYHYPYTSGNVAL